MKRTERTYDKRGVLRSEVVTEEEVSALDALVQAKAHQHGAVGDLLDGHLPEDGCGDPDCAGCVTHAALEAIKAYAPPMWRVIERFDDDYDTLRSTESIDEREAALAEIGTAYAQHVMEQVSHDEMMQAEQAASLSDLLGFPVFSNQDDLLQSLTNRGIVTGEVGEDDKVYLTHPPGTSFETVVYDGSDDDEDAPEEPQEPAGDVEQDGSDG